MSDAGAKGNKRHASSPMQDNDFVKKRRAQAGLNQTASPTAFACPVRNPMPNATGNTCRSPYQAIHMGSIHANSGSMAFADAAADPSGQGTAHGHTRQNPTVDHRTLRSGLRIGTIPIEDVGLRVPANVDPKVQASVRTRMERELRRQEANPPALPPSTVKSLPPKEMAREYREIPDDASEELKCEVRAYNNLISQEIQRIDRERNNQAAKKSRETRLECLRVTREMLNLATAQNAWLRLRMIQMGGAPEE